MTIGNRLVRPRNSRAAEVATSTFQAIGISEGWCLVISPAKSALWPPLLLLIGRAAGRVWSAVNLLICSIVCS
jgi:hypothetical protein